MWRDIIVGGRLRTRFAVLYFRKVSFLLCHSGALSTIRFPSPLSRTRMYVSACFGDNPKIFRFLMLKGCTSRVSVRIFLGFSYESTEQTLCNPSFTCPITYSTTASPLDSPAFVSNSRTSSLMYSILAVSLSLPKGSRAFSVSAFASSVSGIHPPEPSHMVCHAYIVHVKC
jgi:hypothetical protein